MIKKKSIALSVILALIFLGCGRLEPHFRDLGVMHFSVVWEQEQNDIKLVGHFYPIAETSIYSDIIIDTLFGKKGIELPFGEYNSFVHNDYSRKFLYRGMDQYSTAEVYLGLATKTLFSTHNPGIKYIVEADSLYVTQVEKFSINGLSPEYIATLWPSLVPITVSLEIPVDGIGDVAEASASLSGMVESVNLSTGERDISKTASTVFDFEITPTGIKAKFCCFGILKGDNLLNTLDIAFVFKNGTTSIGEHIIDITDKISEDIRQNGGDIVLVDEVKLEMEERITGTMQLAIDWEQNQSNFNSMPAYFYPIVGTSTSTDVIEKTFLASDDKATLPFGEYNALVHNDSADAFLYRGMDQYSTAEVYLSPAATTPFSSRNSGIKYIVEADSLYLAQIERFTVNKEAPDYVTTEQPVLVPITVSLEIPVDGIGDVAEASASLSGMAESVNLSTGLTNITKTASTVFDFDITTTGIKATIHCFGILKGDNLFNTLDIAFTFKNGAESIDKHKIDITDKISDDIRQNGGDIVLDGIEVVMVEPTTGAVQLAIDWDKNQSTFNSLLAYFYPVAGISTSTDVIEKTFSASDDKATLPYGEYNALMHNDHTNAFLYRGMDKYSTAEVYLKEGTLVPFSTLNPGVKYIAQAAPLYLTQIDGVVVNKEAPDYVTTELPKLLPITVSINMPIAGIDRVAQARATLSGMAESVNLSTGATDIDKTASTVFDFEITGTGIEATITCFGILTGGSILNNIDIEFIYKNGITSVPDDHVFDITSKISDDVRENGGNVALDGITVTEPTTGTAQLDLNWTHFSSAQAHFYPISGTSTSTSVVEKTFSASDEKVNLLYGEYNAFVHTDHANFLYRGMDRYSTAEVYLRPGTLVPFTPNAGENYIAQAAPLYLTPIDRFAVNFTTPNYVTTRQPTLAPITVSIKMPIAGIDRVAQARATLSGMAESVNLSTGATDIDKTASTVFDFEITGTGIEATITCFGILTGGSILNNIDIEFIYKNGITSVPDDHVFNITSKISDDVRENGGNVLLDGITVTEPTSGTAQLDINWAQNLSNFTSLQAYFSPLSGTSTSTSVIEKTFSASDEKVDLLYGKYNAFIYNHSNAFDYRGNTYSTAEVSLKAESTLAPFTPNAGESYIVQAAPLYLTQIDLFPVSFLNPDYVMTKEPTLAPISITIVMPIDGIERVEEARATLSGMAKSINLSTGVRDITKTASTVFDFEITATGIIATIKCFGILTGEGVLNNIDIEFKYEDGATSIIDDHVINITSKISTEVRRNGGTVVLDGIKVKEGIDVDDDDIDWDVDDDVDVDDELGG